MKSRRILNNGVAVLTAVFFVALVAVIVGASAFFPTSQAPKSQEHVVGNVTSGLNWKLIGNMT